MKVSIAKSLRVRLITAILLTLVVLIGGSHYYTIHRQSRQFVETIQEQAGMMTHSIVNSIQHDMKGTCLKDIQSIFERIGVIPDIESIRIFDENGMVSKSADPREVGLNVEDIGYEIFKANIPSSPYLGGHGYNAFCMVETIKNAPSCQDCHDPSKKIIGVFELCLSMAKTDTKIAANRRFLTASAAATILLVGIILSVFLTITVNGPVEHLVHVMRRAEEGDLEARANISRRDELGALAASFNAMIGRLETTKREIENLHTEQLIRADRLATVGELAAGVAHEIKNPLAGISAAIQVMAEDFDAKDPRRVITEQIIKQTERMDKTIRDLLNFAQPLQTELVRVEVGAVLDMSLFICLPNPAAQNIVVERRYAPDLPHLVIDSKHLQQVFINIILNALQAMPRGGTLTLTTAVLPPAPDGEGRLRVSIGDSGQGIPPELVEKVFTPFYTTKTEGTGLGLAITRRILELHRGSITFVTAPGRGTTFSIDLPIIAADNPGGQRTT